LFILKTKEIIQNKKYLNYHNLKVGRYLASLYFDFFFSYVIKKIKAINPKKITKLTLGLIVSIRGYVVNDVILGLKYVKEKNINTIKTTKETFATFGFIPSDLFKTAFSEEIFFDFINLLENLDNGFLKLFKTLFFLNIAFDLFFIVNY